MSYQNSLQAAAGSSGAATAQQDASTLAALALAIASARIRYLLIISNVAVGPLSSGDLRDGTQKAKCAGI
jgi:hypothetical protein